MIYYSTLSERELLESLLNRADITVAVLILILGVAAAIIFCYIIYKAIMRFF